MTPKKLPTLIATHPIYLRETVYTTGQPYVARSESEAEEMLQEPSWRKATKQDLIAWATRLAKDPAIAYLRSLPAVTETEYDQHPEEAEKAAQQAEAKRRTDEEQAAQAEAARKAADAARAAAGGNKMLPGTDSGASGGGASGPGGIG